MTTAGVFGVSSELPACHPEPLACHPELVACHPEALEGWSAFKGVVHPSTLREPQGDDQKFLNVKRKL